MKMYFFIFYCYSSFTVLRAQQTNTGQGPKMASDFILQGLNRKYSPCDDIFKFSCSKWVEQYANETDVERMQNQINQVLMDAINDVNVNDKSVPSYKVWVRNFFDQCVQAVKSLSSQSESLKQIYDGLQNLLGPPPALITDIAARNLFRTVNIWNLLGQIQRILGDGVIFDTTIDNIRNEDGKIIPALTFSAPFIAEDDMVGSEIKSDILGIANSLGIQVNNYEFDRRLENIMNLDARLKRYINQTVFVENVHDSTYVTSSVSQLKAVNPSIEWQEFFRGLLSDSQYNNWDQRQTSFQLRNKKYFEQIDQIVKAYEPETIFSYMFYREIKRDKVLINDVTNNENTPEDTCINLAKSLYDSALAKMYFDYTEQDPIKWSNDLSIIIDNIFTSFKYSANKADWLTIEEKGNIFQKVNSITYTQPVPDWLQSDKSVEDRTVRYDQGKSVHYNILNIIRENFNFDLDRLAQNEPLDKFDFFGSGKSYYQDMTLYITFGDVLPPIYHFLYPSAVKYGLFGSGIAELLLQAFSMDNVYEIPKGMKNRWLNENNSRKFQDEENCIVNQTKLTNCPDNARNCSQRGLLMSEDNDVLLREIDAIKLAYSAAKLSYQNEADKQSLPNLTDYTWDQIFFISVGRMFCSSSIDLEVSKIEEGSNSLMINRLFKVFRNIPLVSQTFQCASSGSLRANPKCSIWEN